MAMIRISPVEVAVGTDWFSGRPRTVRLARGEVPVTAVGRVREESAAYPAATGPRTLFEIDTPEARLSLAFEHRRRRWVLEALDADVQPDENVEAFPGTARMGVAA